MPPGPLDDVLFRTCNPFGPGQLAIDLRGIYRYARRIMKIRELLERNRSYRRFHENRAVERETLRELVELARLSPSAANRQPIKFILSHDPHRNALVFAHLAWAGYLKDWPGPPEGERPAAYIIILGDTEISSSVKWDHGIVAQSMLLGAVEKGLGGCMIGSIDREGLRADLGIPGRYDILLVLAIGVPKETVQLETVGPDGDIKYWRDGTGVHHVPKRALDDLIIE
jgi:nitroreductase